MMNIPNCSCCQMDTAGNHEWNCPNNPNRQEPVILSHACPLVCHGNVAQAKPTRLHSSIYADPDGKIELLRKVLREKEHKLSLALAALKEIAEHEHLKCLESECKGIDPVKISDWLYEIQKTNLTLGKIYGHRCCAAIAAKCLEEHKL